MQRSTVLFLLLFGLTAACGNDPATPPSLDLACLEEGRCECLTNLDCALNFVCTDGECVAKQVGDISEGDAVDVALPQDTAEEDTNISPGSFLSPCQENSECDSNKCLLSSDGTGVCTKSCIDDCPPGWDCRGVDEGPAGLTFYCLPAQNRLCEGCSTDSNCPGEDSLCLDLDGTLHCGSDCSNQSCPGGYVCENVESIEGTPGQQCIPEFGYCQCTAITAGIEVNCTEANEFGACPGLRTCLSDGSLTACDAKTPSAETCDDQDNDCDGFTDEEIPQVACENTNEFGTCVGLVFCIAGGAELCNAALAGPEICDQLDNDCDDFTDEEFVDENGDYNSLEHCGGCGLSCEGKFANVAELACVEGTCQIAACAPGYTQLSETLCGKLLSQLCEPCTSDDSCVNPGDKCLQLSPADPQTFCGRDCAPDNLYNEGCPTGYTCQTLTLDGAESSQCVPTNNSCDCLEFNAGQQKPCTIQNEHGSCYGMSSCDPAAGWTGCTAQTPEKEVCNGQDDNCDGLVDEGTSGIPCLFSTQYGTCPGTVQCKGADGVVCNAPPALPEVCDGLDNNCDGQTDEGFATTTEEGELVYGVSETHCGGCGVACLPGGPVASVACQVTDNVAACVVTACEPGFYQYENTCIPVPSNTLCLPCEADNDCLGPQDSCVNYADGAGCGRDCSEGSIYSVGLPGDAAYCTGAEGEQGCCEAGFLCTEGQCQRESQSCSCDEDGKIQPCELTNEWGTCSGVQVCATGGDTAGWQACTALPQPEICDSLDNDCDGLVDADDDSLDVTNLEGYPACSKESCVGNWVCAAGATGNEWTCTAPDPVPETCNGLDDDCDLGIDEDFKDAQGEWSLLDHCGQCGLACSQVVPNAIDVGCEPLDGQYTCVPTTCAEGFIAVPADAPTTCVKLQPKSCQPCSDDSECGLAEDACIAIGSEPGTYCAQRCGVDAPYSGCTGAVGEQGCCPSGFTCNDVELCIPDSGSCQCTPNTIGLVRSCTKDDCFGTETCTNGAEGVGWGTCDTSANVEICDGVDNNCDGQTDEGFLNDGLYSTQEHCGACGKSCDLVFSPSQHATASCDANAPGGPACTLSTCTSEWVGGGGFCNIDADCPQGACLTGIGQCALPCQDDNDCGPAASCRGGGCAPACNTDNDCISPATCDSGTCATDFTFEDLDQLPGNGCECAASVSQEYVPTILSTYPSAGAVYPDRDCDGVDGSAELSIFVRSGAENGDGSLTNPFGSIQEAIDSDVMSQQHPILVATGIYLEQVRLEEEVHLFGGYSLDFQQRDVVLFPTVIAAPTVDPNEPGTVSAVGIQDARVEGFTIRGADATTPGTTTYAVYVANGGQQLLIRANRIEGGQGAPGTNGGPGVAGTAGNAGESGLTSNECVAGVTCTGSCDGKTCAGHQQAGGLGGTNAACGAAAGCQGMEAEGNESPQKTDAPAPGCSYANGGSSATYQGGPSSLCKYDCYVNSSMNGPSGSDGSAGNAGTSGAGCTLAAGSTTNGQWVSSSGESGTTGSPGAGGQGGSSGGYVRNTKSSSCSVGNNLGDLGGSGGGGGAGGCAGGSGIPGSSGGGSFAVFISSEGPNSPFPLQVHGNVIVRGPGGNGGNGGSGGDGGKGGAGGIGGIAQNPAWCAGAGGTGGRGGDGGGGGGGGGGCGGPSIGLATVNLNIGTFLNNNVFVNSDVTGGLGGLGGPSPVSSAEGQAGVNGYTGDTYAF